MPQRRVVNKQSNLITVTSYTPFRHQREVGLGKMFQPHRLFVPVAVGLGRARADWGAFHVSRGLKPLLTASTHSSTSHSNQHLTNSDTS